VPLHTLPVIAERHATWSHGRLFRRPLSGVVRAELARHGAVLTGPPIGDLIADPTPAALRESVRSELTGYWSWTLRRRALWWSNEHVDLAMLTMARADAALTEGTLVTKSEALLRLPRLGAPPDLVEDVTRRRHGGPTRLGPAARARRARRARSTTASLVERLLATERGRSG
jgi:hypothetical protein